MVSTKKIKINIRNKQASFFFDQAKKTNEQLLKDFCSTPHGLKLAEVKEKQDRYGLNILANKSKQTWYKTLWSSFFNIFSWILIVIAILNVTISHDNRDWCSFTILMIIFLVSGILKFIQEFKANNAMQKLNRTIKTTASILRENIKSEIPISEIVPGDIIYLAAGDMIPCDMRLFYTKDLFITQSIISGESEPVEKIAQPITQNITNILNCNNICYMGTTVASGSAYGIAIQTGKSTFLGKIATIIAGKRPKTNFDKGIKKVGIIIVEIMSLMSIIIFLIYGLITHRGVMQSWIKALIFSLSVAISIIPEMLPMIVTLNLAKEAIKFSRQKAIVKNINSIQTFGAMNILCTDKTGTLTEDHIILQKYLNVMGDEDNNVLLYGCLNSYYQTGLKNLIDLAVIEKADKIGIDDPIMGFRKVDEIPFDFKRKRMSVIIEDNQNKRLLVTKGASEEIIDICDYCEYKGDKLPFDKQLKNRAFKIVNHLNQDGMRVIAVAVNHDELPTNRPFNTNDEKHMCLIGFIALLDPPKESAADAVKALMNHGVTVKVLTGDNDIISRYVCKTVGIDASHVLLGSDINNMDDEELKRVVMNVNIFAKLSPEQKSRIVLAIKSNKHVVGYMGDGINDAAAMRVADIGISVDTAVDIAKESADIILLKKDLRILNSGVVEGRKTFCNIIKYIKMTISSNFGNMLSVLFAAIWLSFAISTTQSIGTFTPMVAIHILILNIIYDFSQYTIPWDNVDENYIKYPRQWDPKSIFKFMLCIGPVSTIFDIASFMIMFYGFGWNNSDFQNQFSTGWFFESLLTQIAVIYVLRTEKIPFVQSKPSNLVNLSLLVIFMFGLILALVPNLNDAHFASLAMNMPIWILYSFLLTFTYMVFAQGAKKIYIHSFKEWL